MRRWNWRDAHVADEDKTLPERALSDGDVVTFDATDSKAPTPGASLGTAEFAFCPKWVRGKLQAVYICPMQQRDVVERWRVECHGAMDFTVQSWTHKGIQEPRPWLYFWCKEHGCMGMRVYVPRNAGQFSVRTGSGVGIHFDRAAA